MSKLKKAIKAYSQHSPTLKKAVESWHSRTYKACSSCGTYVKRNVVKPEDCVFDKITDSKELVTFYKDNPSDFLFEPERLDEAAHYYGLKYKGKLVAVTSYVRVTEHLAMLQKTLVCVMHRKLGLASELNKQMEALLKSRSFGKVIAHIYTENTTNVTFRIKRGYLVEGLLRDHDFIGQHEYILGKVL